MALGEQEAELTLRETDEIIDRVCDVASTFSTLAKRLYPDRITGETLRSIQMRIDANSKALRRR